MILVQMLVAFKNCFLTHPLTPKARTKWTSQKQDMYPSI
jgi:hypothetical protein